MKTSPVDRWFLALLVLLAGGGFFIFTSASLGLLARSGAHFGAVALNQLALGLGLGAAAAFFASRIYYRTWKRWSLWILIAAILVTLLVFVPGIGLASGGARRWIAVGSYSFQPAEFLKMAFVMYTAAWLAGVREKVTSWRFGLLPLLILLGVVGVILLSQPDTDTLVVMGLAVVGQFLAAGGRFRHIAVLAVAAILGVSILVWSRPYLLERFSTFLDPARDPLGAGYQIQQSLIAIGSGEFSGRGFGKSIQKFSYLPEPIGDSIFAVAAEEFGFVGSAGLIILYLLFAFRGIRIASRSPDAFGGLLAVGIVILITASSFMNIASMLGVIPLSGLPLLFVSQGGSAMLFALFEVGIMLNISRFAKSR